MNEKENFLEKGEAYAEKNHQTVCRTVECSGAAPWRTDGMRRYQGNRESEAVPADAPAAATAGGELTSGENTGDTAADGATSIHVVAVGDNLVQECVYNSAKAHAENGEEYNFDYCYDNVKG